MDYVPFGAEKYIFIISFHLLFYLFVKDNVVDNS